MRKLLLNTLIMIGALSFSVSFVAAQEDCADDSYIVFSSGEAYSINDPNTEPLTLISDVQMYVPEGYISDSSLFSMDFSSVTSTLAFTDGWDVFLLSADDDTPRQITPTDTETYEYIQFGGLSWSPDGQSLALAVRADPIADGLMQVLILIYDVEQETWREVLELIDDDWGVSTYLDILRWSPDGSTIAFTLGTIGHGFVYVTYYFETACLEDGECDFSEILMRPRDNESGVPENRYAPDWTSDNRLGFICGDDLCLFERESAQVERMEALDILDEFMWLPCGNRIVYQYEDANFLIRDLDSGEETTLLTIEQSRFLFQTHELLAIVPMPDAAFLFESSDG
jgi:hypothetical protein